GYRLTGSQRSKPAASSSMSGSSSKLTYPSFPFVCSHAGKNTFWADLTSSSSSCHAIWSSVRPCPISSLIRPSKCPRPMILETMAGFEVAPVIQNHRAKIGKHTSELQSPDHLVCRLLLEKIQTT